MSLPLRDLGSIKVSEQAHSYLRAEAADARLDVAALVRDLVEAHVRRRLSVLRMAQDIHEAKGLGEIDGGAE